MKIFGETMMNIIHTERKYKMNFKRIFLIILDSAGIGEAIDAKKFGDNGANTLKHTIEYGNLNLPYLNWLGLSSLLNEESKTAGYHGILAPVSNGKDTLTGHLEMMGIETKIPYKVFPDGFPKELLKEIERVSGHSVIGNRVASGTEIIKQLGKEHIETGHLIVYTSADSVLQIAAHEEIIPLEELYSICEKVREITKRAEWRVGRVIARPFVGTPGNFTRTANRHDYALDPAGTTVLDELKQNGYEVIGIGKIADIFNNKGITASYKTLDNEDGIKKILEIEASSFNGLCFANLNDFDSKYGHRRDPGGYGRALQRFDAAIPEIVQNLNEDDLLMIAADHGNDPTFKGTDHTRENVPILMFSKSFKYTGVLPYIGNFADIGASIAKNFNVEMPKIGKDLFEIFR